VLFSQANSPPHHGRWVQLEFFAFICVAQGAARSLPPNCNPNFSFIGGVGNLDLRKHFWKVTYSAPPLVGDALNFRLLILALQGESKRSVRDIHKRTIHREREREREMAVGVLALQGSFREHIACELLLLLFCVFHVVLITNYNHVPSIRRRMGTCGFK
jgi:hypothetical protein